MSNFQAVVVSRGRAGPTAASRRREGLAGASWGQVGEEQDPREELVRQLDLVRREEQGTSAGGAGDKNGMRPLPYPFGLDSALRARLATQAARESFAPPSRRAKISRARTRASSSRAYAPPPRRLARLLAA